MGKYVRGRAGLLWSTDPGKAGIRKNVNSKGEYMNKVILMGRLTRDPDVRYSNGEDAMAVARFYPCCGP